VLPAAGVSFATTAADREDDGEDGVAAEAAAPSIS
jgi:hypothetical protein